MNKQRISEHVSYEEATRSGTAERYSLSNDPPEELIEVGRMTAKELFEPVRNHFGCRIAITSFYRSPEVNAILEKNADIVASKKSQHMLFEAMDMNARIFGGCTNRQIFDFVRENLDFDQLIWEDIEGDEEPEWIHVSRKKDPSKNRKECLRRFRKDGKSRYEKL